MANKTKKELELEKNNLELREEIEHLRDLVGTYASKVKKPKYTLEELVSQMEPEHDICGYCFDDVDECTQCGKGLLALSKRNDELLAAMEEHKIGNLKSYDDYEEMMKDINKECENCADMNESSCLDCGRRFECKPMQEDNCSFECDEDCIDCNKLFLPNDKLKDLFKNDKDLSGKTPLELIPLEFLEYSATPVQIGSLKGYQSGSWKEFMPHSKWIAAALRHIIAFQKGVKGDKGLYTEYHPKTKEPISVQASHIRAAIFNLSRVQWSIEHNKVDEDDR